MTRMNASWFLRGENRFDARLVLVEKRGGRDFK